MPTILNIDTATSACSVALSHNGQLLSIANSAIGNSHSAVLTTLIEEVLSNSATSISNIDAIAVNEGPGSYTGLRIGVSTAKGLCYALDKPLIAISGLKSMAVGMSEERKVKSEKGEAASLKPQASSRKPEARSEKREARSEILLCPMLDARRMEVYCAFFDFQLNIVRETSAVVIDEHSFSDVLQENLVLFAGDGAEKCKAILEKYENARFIDDFKPSAKFMIPLAEERFARHEFENLAYFEPFYLKDFVAGKPRVKGLV